MIKADLKHWAGKREVKGPLKVGYEIFANQAKEKLGAGGLVGIPNAREDEFRFEEFYGMAKKQSSITPLGDGRVFHDNDYDLWFVKCQEVINKKDDLKLTFLLYNIPLNKNFKEILYEGLRDLSTIAILNLPSSKIPNPRVRDYIFDLYKDRLSGIIIHTSSATILLKANEYAEILYNQFTQKAGNKVGAIAVSGGHRSPKNNLIKIIIPPSVGSSYSSFPKFNGNTQEDFFNWFRTSVQNSTPEKLHKGSCAREMLFRHIPSMVKGKFFK